MSNLKSYVIHTIGGGWGKETIEENLIKVSVIRGTDFPKLEKLDFSSVPIRFETLKKIESRTLQVGDLIIEVSGGSASSGQRTGRCLYITQEILDNLGKYVIPASFCRLLRLDKEKINSKFIYYQIAEMHLSDQIGIYENQSTGISNFQFNLFLDEIFPKITDLNKQNSIVDIFNSIDQKIQLNTQINQTLEQIAQALFKSWFVDFDPVRAKVQALSDGMSLEQAELTAMQAISGKTAEELTALSQTHPERYAELAETAKAFPCEMVEVDGVEVPRGWDNQSVGDVINVVDYVANGSFATLKENVTLLTEPDYAIYVRTTDFNSGFSKELRYVNKSAYDFLAKSVLIGNEVIISNVGDVGTVFRSPSWLGMPMTLGSNAIALKNYDIPHYLYLYFSSHKGQHDISSIVTGSAQLKFNKTNFRSLKVLMPNNSLLTKFEKFVLPIFEKIDANMAENLKLAEIRDLLLPRLLSGNALWIKK